MSRILHFFSHFLDEIFKLIYVTFRVTYNFTDSPERLKVNKDQILQEEKQIKRAKHSFSFNSGSTILAGSPPRKDYPDTAVSKSGIRIVFTLPFYFTKRRDAMKSVLFSYVAHYPFFCLSLWLSSHKSAKVFLLLP